MDNASNEKRLYPKEVEQILDMWYDGDWNDALIGLHLYESRKNTGMVGEGQQD
jgi:hypothetical protein